MMEKHSAASRRSFLKISAAAGVGTLVCAENSAKGAVEQQCGYRLSAFEALSMLSELLFRIQGDSFVLLNQKLETVAEDCQEQFKKLCVSVEQLTSKLRSGTDAAARAQHMKVLADLGCSSATGLANTNPTGSTALLKSLEVVNKEIGLAAQALLPDGETVLSAEATAILRSIIVQVHESAALQRSIDKARNSLVTSRELILKGTQNLHNLIFKAGAEILTAESGKATERERAREEAVKQLEAIRTALEEFISQLTDRQLYSPNSSGDFLLAALEGMQQWVKDPASVGAASPVAVNGRRSSFAIRRNHVDAHSYAAFGGFDPGTITGLLRSYCPPDGAVHVTQVITAMTAVAAWKIGRDFGGIFTRRPKVTPGEVLQKVRSGLYFLRFSCRPVNNQVPNPEELAKQIAKLITG